MADHAEDAGSTTVRANQHPVVEPIVGLDQANNIGMRDFVFTSARGNPVCSSTERYQWMKALKAAGLPQVKIHSAHHWMATMAARANMPDDARIAVMGHTSMQMTMRYTQPRRRLAWPAHGRRHTRPRGGEIVEAEIMEDAV